MPQRLPSSPLRLLLLLTQLPQDPTSGAARCMRTMGRQLADPAPAGSGMPDFEVRALATTASEGGTLPGGSFSYLRQASFPVSSELTGRHGRDRILRFDDGSMSCTLLDMPGFLREPDPRRARLFGDLLEDALRWQPDIVLTYGGQPHEIAWRKRAREAGARVVFGLRNLGYLNVKPEFFGPQGSVDAVLSASEFIANKYRAAIGLESTPLPIPMATDDILAPEPLERVFATYINPSAEKGVYFAVRLLDELAAKRPDIPLLVIQSRGTAGSLLLAAAAGGIDLQRHENLMISPSVPAPRDIYAVSRMVLMPSACEEAAGRVAAEALMNGIPPIVSNRGGLPEIAGNGGVILGLPEALTVDSTQPAAAGEVTEWIEAIERFYDDEPAYQQACARARARGADFLPEALVPRYREYFASVAGR